MIKVKEEGRLGVWIVTDKQSLVDFVQDNCGERIHCFIQTGNCITGADWSKESVIDEINKAERLAVLTKPAAINNMNHNLSVIVGNTLKMFDIGDLGELLIEDEEND